MTSVTINGGVGSGSHRLGGPVLVYGFGTAVVMWVVAYALHLPGLGLPTAVSGTALALALAVGPLLAGRLLRGVRGIKAGGLAGMLAAAINLVILGSWIAETAHPPAPPTTQDAATAAPPPAWAIALGFVAAGAIIGAIGGAIGGLLPPPGGTGAPPVTSSHRRPEPGATIWLGRFAVVTALSFLPLLISGGVVTSTESALAVPDWPGTYGANMFFYPIGLMLHQSPRIFFEHSHRLLGSLVGLTTLALTIYTLVRADRQPLKLWAVALFGLVCAQGLIGGLRVTEKSTGLALAHGVSAQVAFAVAVAIAVWASPGWKLPIDAFDRRDRRLRFFATGLFHTLILQLLLGAAFRHMGHIHIAFTHAAFAFVVVTFAAIAGVLAASTGSGSDHPRDRALRWSGRALLGAIALQFTLGWVALFAVLAADDRGPLPTAENLAEAPPVPVGEVLITAAHQFVGACVLGLATVVFLWARRAPRSPAPVGAPVEPPAPSLAAAARSPIDR